MYLKDAEGYVIFRLFASVFNLLYTFVFYYLAFLLKEFEKRKKMCSQNKKARDLILYTHTPSWGVHGTKYINIRKIY